ncbi:MAG: tRNA epoxyqueuosine(34) reductase QueG [Alphaproteobacteria bacterium]
MLEFSVLQSRVQALGFYHASVIPINIPKKLLTQYDKFIANHYHGSMSWLAKHRPARADPKKIFPQAKSILILTHPYPFIEKLKDYHEPVGTIARYARGMDYHLLLKQKLAVLQSWLKNQNIESRMITDSAPFFEKPMAAIAGIGWQGKHTNLLSHEIGNWFFLAEVFLSSEVKSKTKNKPQKKKMPTCGSCRACLDACPTDAFPKPYQLDARKCISYLTIEHTGLIDKKFHHAIGDMIFGCDLCLAACPFNKFAHQAKHLKQDALLQGSATLSLDKILNMNQTLFNHYFSQSPIKRLGLARLKRNALIALSNFFYNQTTKHHNSKQQKFLPIVISLLNDDNFMVRGSAITALHAIDKKIFNHEKQHRITNETNQAVINEWHNNKI